MCVQTALQQIYRDTYLLYHADSENTSKILKSSALVSWEVRSRPHAAIPPAAAMLQYMRASKMRVRASAPSRCRRCHQRQCHTAKCASATLCTIKVHSHTFTHTRRTCVRRGADGHACPRSDRLMCVRRSKRAKHGQNNCWLRAVGDHKPQQQQQKTLNRGKLLHAKSSQTFFLIYSPKL